jgi:predicted transcriptional regulator YdeE
LGELLGPAFYEVHWSIGVMSPAKDSSKMNYMAPIRLKDSGGQTEGLETLEFPGGSYLACEHVGRVEEMAQTTRWFYGQYLPSSAAQVRDGYHIEIYDDRFDPTSDHSVALIAVPI